jgi:hypothetical protein
MSTRKDTGTDGIVTRRDVGGPDGIANAKVTGEDDVEGHNFMVNPDLARALSKARSVDLERGARARQNETEAKRPFRK